MEWIKIEKKWHEIAYRLQIGAPRGVPAKPRATNDDTTPAPAQEPATETTDTSVMPMRATG